MKKMIGMMNLVFGLTLGCVIWSAGASAATRADVDAAKDMVVSGKVEQGIAALKVIAEDKKTDGYIRHLGLHYALTYMLKTDKSAAMTYLDLAQNFGIEQRLYNIIEADIYCKAKEWTLAIDAGNRLLSSAEQHACWNLCLAYNAQGNKTMAFSSARRGLLSPSRKDYGIALFLWNYVDKHAPTFMSNEEHLALVQEVNRSYPPPGQDVGKWADFLGIVRFRLESLQ